MAEPAAVRSRPRLPSRIGIPLLFLGAVAFSAATMLHGVQPNDEGLMLQAARRIAGGQVPYRDFWWYYPPGQPYLLAALWKLFGPSLVGWRIVRVATDAAVAVLAYLLARRRAPTWLALAAALTAEVGMALPSGPHPFPVALALALAALLLFERRPLAAGIVAGVCAAWRIEFAAYLGLGVAVAALLAEGPARERVTRFARFALPALAVALVIYAPVVAAAGLGRSWRLLVEYPIFDFGRYQSLPFPLHYDGALNTSSPGGFLRDSAESLLAFYLPLALLVAAVGGCASVLARLRRADPGPAAVVVFAVGMAHYMLARTDAFHTAPLQVMVAVLAAWALAGTRIRALRTPPRARRLGYAAAAAAAAGGLVWSLAVGLDRRVRNLDETTVALPFDVADGVRVRPMRAAPLIRSVAFVQAHVPPGQPIYVIGARADLVTSGNPLFYVVADRPNPTPYDIAAPGVVTSAPVQREIVRDLRRARPRVVLRWTAPVTAQREPNLAGRSSGVTILDDYLRADYRLARRFGFYLLLVPRGPGDAPPG